MTQLLTVMVVAFGGGLMSFFSPCVLPLAPGYLTYITGASAIDAGGGGVRVGRAVWRDLGRTALFFGAVALVVLSLGSILSGLGWFLFQHQSTITRIGGVLVLLMAVVASGVIPQSQRQAMLRLRSVGWLSAPALGFVFAASWTPCITPVLTSIAVLGSASGSFGVAATASVAYALGLSLPFFGMVLGVRLVGRTSSFLRPHARLARTATVVVLVAVGVLMLTDSWTVLMRQSVVLGAS